MRYSGESSYSALVDDFVDSLNSDFIGSPKNGLMNYYKSQQNVQIRPIPKSSFNHNSQ